MQSLSVGESKHLRLAWMEEEIEHGWRRKLKSLSMDGENVGLSLKKTPAREHGKEVDFLKNRLKGGGFLT